MRPDDPRHGTYAGAVAHWLSDERPCAPCAKAETRYRKLRKLRHLKGEPPMVPSVGLVRRYEALLALGYTGPQISEAVGISVNSLRSVRYHGSDLVRATTFERFAAAYERLCMTVPDGQYARRARSIARSRGWAPPLAWDNIDDPDEQPWTAPERPAGRPERAAAVVEEFDWLTGCGESPENAADRLGVSLATVRDYRTLLARRGYREAS